MNHKSYAIHNCNIIYIMPIGIIIEDKHDYKLHLIQKLNIVNTY